MRSFATLLVLAVGALHTVIAQEVAPSDELAVIDLRPQEEKEGFGLAELAGRCNRDVFRVPDVATDPLKVELLKSLLNQQLPLIGERKTLTVLNWSIYYNKQVQGGSGNGVSSVGVGGYSIPTKKKEGRRPGSDCSKRESAGGWYQGSELQSNYFPLVSEFEGTFAGKPLSVRIVHSPRRKIEGKFEGDPGDMQEVLDTVQETAEALATAISR
jgi:hypothetical protein